jgi:hypothetical protein
MSLVPDIVESWRAPRRVLRRHMARPRSEAFLFTFLFTFLLIAFVAQAPYAARLAHFQPEVPMPQRLFAAFLGLIATLPLWYGLAALSRLVARALGGQGSWYGARLALFWALVTITPGMLLMGLSLGILGQGAQTNALGVLVGLAFLVFWITFLREAERG